jgi:ferric-dicitrate binding protein FerR (iron transport regulator)
MKTYSNGKENIEKVNSNDIYTADVVISKHINTDIYTSWRGKRWIFERENLSEFTKILERRYDVRIYVMDPKLNEYKITGSIEQQTLEQLLNAVRLTVPIYYRISNKEVILTLDKRLEKDYKMLMK